MANYFPLILDSATPEIKELPSGDDLDLANSSIVNAASIEVVGNVTAGNLVAIATVGTGHLLLSGNVTGNITPSANVTFDLGTTNQRWKDLYLSDSTIYLGNAQMSANATALIFTNPEGGQTVFSGTNPGIAVTTVVATGNVTGGNVNADGQVVAAGNVTGGNVNTAGQIVSTGNVSGGNVNTTGQVVAAGNVTGDFFIGNGSLLTGIDATSIQNGTSNVRVVSAAGDVTVSINSVSNVAVFASTGVEVIGNLGASGSITATGNVSGGNLLGTGITGTLLTAAQTNITSVGTLASLAVDGNISADGNISTTNTLVANVLTVSTTASISGNLNMNSQNITSLADPVSAQDAATKVYVDNLVTSGTHFHEPVRVEAPINLTVTYDNGTAGVGATLTNAGTQAALVIDGITLVVADRVLIYEQTDQTQNGVYVVTDVGSGATNWILTRSADADTFGFAGPDTLSEGSTFFVQQGATGAGETYTCNTVGTITFGTTNITFAQISSAQIYSAGTGLALNSTEFSIANTAVSSGSYGGADQVASFTVNPQGQLTAASNTVITANAANLSGTVLNSSVVGSSLTSVGTLISLAVTGNVTSGNLSGTSIVGTLTTAAQTNITSVGTLTALTVTGDVTGGNLITAGFVSLSSITKTGANGSGNIGAAASTFNTIFARATSASYADLAELYTADTEYQPGTVLVFGGTAEVTQTTESHDIRIAGVVSTNPAHVMNSALTGEHTAVVALMGRVPCRVIGPVRQGDCMVSSGTPGVAQALDATKYLPGAIIGKALQDYHGSEPGVIEVVVGRL